MNLLEIDLNTLANQLPPLVPTPVLLPVLFDYSATFIWALSGALVAARRGYTGMSVFVIATASATGGGLSQTHAAFVTIAIVFVLNAIMLHFNIKSRPLEDFRKYWEDRP